MVPLTDTPIAWDCLADTNGDGSPDGCGAVVTFVGVVRPDRCDGRRVTALWYDAYREMAEQMILNLVEEAKTHWSLTSAQVQHRLGRVGAGEISVVVAVAAPHRDNAYAASRFLIERIKQDVPVWKREQYDDGASQWMDRC